jgi:6-pyruvoyl-tetrahydropterin synthase
MSLTYVTSTDIFVTTEFIAFHRWPKASEYFPKRFYLEDLHRHKFFVRLEIEVAHDDRELEYHEVKESLDAMIRQWTDYDWNETDSCEMMAKWILQWAMDHWPDRHRYMVSVAEDNENGSIVEANDADRA